MTSACKNCPHAYIYYSQGRKDGIRKLGCTKRNGIVKHQPKQCDLKSQA